ncbi:hypothetical protein PPL_01829 [Heterostelium album PN500]|uniref:Uncharacterized protein n=1 Tax=Heterostelium pallidum (strain ATCC 26659 / Pp 5 / PN500) TaxID=670386 RepID=D3B0L2_HETP5|nr:hypothetical protein PPL_01829 [Heterostelium album PN500]EFA84836.1 hypothetical protein PPL_01829 [Heterostelium album PN500]|eukprot:XP_020436947.1 hypothetical protein PPL_01829 [Heterostelium album PN500]
MIFSPTTIKNSILPVVFIFFTMISLILLTISLVDTWYEIKLPSNGYFYKFNLYRYYEYSPGVFSSAYYYDIIKKNGFEKTKHLQLFVVEAILQYFCFFSFIALVIAIYYSYKKNESRNLNLAIVFSSLLSLFQLTSILLLVGLPSAFKSSNFHCGSDNWCTALNGSRDGAQWKIRGGYNFAIAQLVLSMVCLATLIIRYKLDDRADTKQPNKDNQVDLIESSKPNPINMF